MSKVAEGYELRVVLRARLAERGARLRPDDLMAEAGRKVLLKEFRKVLANEAGSRSGADIEDVHRMRVAMRKSRSALRLLRGFYRPGVTRRHGRALRRTMRALGPVRDLDVLIENLGRFAMPEQKMRERGLAALEWRRTVARREMLTELDSGAWERFLLAYTDFLTTPGAGALPRERYEPQRVAQLLPLLVHEALAQVRAYGPSPAEGDSETLHDLRIACKRLRYTLTLFSALAGPELGAYIAALKQLQDVLGRINDIAVAEATLPGMLPGLDEASGGLLRRYQEAMAEERPQLLARLPAVWEHFNSRAVQGELAMALLAL